METFSVLLGLCAGNSPVTGEFPAQRPVTRSFDVFFDLRLINGLVNNRKAGDLRRHRALHDVTVMVTVMVTMLTWLCCALKYASYSPAHCRASCWWVSLWRSRPVLSSSAHRSWASPDEHRRRYVAAVPPSRPPPSLHWRTSSGDCPLTRSQPAKSTWHWGPARWHPPGGRGTCVWKGKETTVNIHDIGIMELTPGFHGKSILSWFAPSLRSGTFIKTNACELLKNKNS